MNEDIHAPADAPKPVLRLKSQKFREARQSDWRALSTQLDKVEKRGLGSFSIDELLNLPLLYRSAMSSLSMAQSISLDRNMITYLQALCVRAYVYVYGPQTRLKDVLYSFFVLAWPRAVRRLGGEIALAFATLVAGAIAGWLMCAHDSTWYNVFLPGEQGSRGLDSSAEELRKTIGGNPENHALSPFAVFLMTHNVGVAISTFAFGAVFGLPTFALTLYTGITLGAMVWLFAQQGLGFEFAAWLTIHGTTELFALVIAAGCGFHIARRLMFPGDATRKQALREAGTLTGTAMIGVAIMLTVAGCLEGIGRQMLTDPFVRIGIGAVMLTIWGLYYTSVGRRKPGGGRLMAKAGKRDLASDAPYGEIGRTATEILTPEGVVLPFINATFGERVGALLLDWLIMILAPVIVLIIWLILPLEHVFDNGKNKALGSFVLIVAMFFLFFLRSGYFIIFEMGARAATPGKRVMKLRVISHDGGRLTPAAVFTRNALREVELYLPVTLIFAWSANHSAGSWLAFLWALALLLLPLFNKQHARLGDFLAGTRVVHMPKAALSYDLADLEGDRNLGLSFTPDQLAYGEMELTVLEQVLRERKPAVMKAVAARIKARINWVDPKNDPPGDETFLRAYYGALRAHLEAKMLLGRRRKDKHDAPV